MIFKVVKVYIIFLASFFFLIVPYEKLCSCTGILSGIFLYLFAWQGNFEQWILDPIHIRPIAHSIWDPHFGSSAIEAFSKFSSLQPVNISYSGVYHWWYRLTKFYILFIE